MYLQCIRESKRNFKSIGVRELTNQRDATHFENERVCKGFMLCKRDSVLKNAIKSEFSGGFGVEFPNFF